MIARIECPHVVVKAMPSAKSILLISVYKGIHGQNRNVKVKIQADKYMRLTRKVIYCKVLNGLQRIQESIRSVDYIRFDPM